jgi:protein tyrosine phosphatase (PTP) superfamily phosphohydrolase (DUF442 family)
VNRDAIQALQLPQQGQPDANIVTAGQPSPQQLQALRTAGVGHVINLRPPEEDAGFDESATVAALGMGYTVIPVAGPADLSMASAKALDQALAQVGDAGVLIHCASSNRVGALLALRAAWLHGAAPDDALAVGAAGGLTKMQPMVESLLQKGPPSA